MVLSIISNVVLFVVVVLLLLLIKSMVFVVLVVVLVVVDGLFVEKEVLLRLVDKVGVVFDLFNRRRLSGTIGVELVLLNTVIAVVFDYVDTMINQQFIF